MKCIEDEIPFEVPEGWEWTRLGYLAQYKKGPFGSSITKSMFVPDSPDAIKIYEQKNAINKDATLGNYFISSEKYETLKGFEVFPNDIIVSCAGTIGEAYVLPKEMRKGIINQALMKISLYDLELLDFYLMYFDFQLKNAAQEEGHGIALKNIPPFDILKRYLVPIPPISEQSRIITTTNSLLAKINSIDTDGDIIIELITKAKSKILDLAIRGKLVPQDPNDEPASVLLERIREEKEELIKQGKIKRDKKESIIFRGDDNSYYEKIGNEVHCIDEEIPFEVPHNWIWCRMSSISDIIMGTSPKGTSICEDPQYTEFHQGKFFFSDMVIKNSAQYTRELTKIAKPNSILLCVRAPVGEVNLTDREICIGRGLASISPFDAISEYFMLYWIKAFKETLIEKATGTTFVAVTTDVVKELLLPIPPVAEQYRITNKIQCILKNLTYIEKSLS